MIDGATDAIGPVGEHGLHLQALSVEHVASSTCWCRPIRSFVGMTPMDEKAVYVHRIDEPLDPFARARRDLLSMGVAAQKRLEGGRVVAVDPAYVTLRDPEWCEIDGYGYLGVPGNHRPTCPKATKS